MDFKKRVIEELGMTGHASSHLWDGYVDICEKIAKEYHSKQLKTEIQESVKVLKHYNEWRRDPNVPNKLKQPDPKLIGVAIDNIVRAFERVPDTKKTTGNETDFVTKSEIVYKGIPFTVHYVYQPEEPQNGVKESIEIDEIMFEGTNFFEVLENEIKEIEKLVWEEMEEGVSANF